MRSAQADTASKPASKTHLSTVEPIFLTKIIQQYFNISHLLWNWSLFLLCLISALFDICFVDLNPSIRGFRVRTELSNNFGSSLITQAWTKTQRSWQKLLGFGKHRKHHKNHRFTQLQPHLASSIFAAVECKPSVGPNWVTTDSSKRSCSSVKVEVVEAVSVKLGYLFNV